MKKLTKILLIVIVLILFISCKSPAPTYQYIDRQVLIKDTSIMVQAPAMSGGGYGLPLIVFNNDTIKDTVFQYVKINKTNKDTIVKIKFTPANNHFDYYFKPDSIRVTAKNTETISINKEIYKERLSLFDKFKIALNGLIIFILLFLIIKYLYKLFKFKLWK